VSQEELTVMYAAKVAQANLKSVINKKACFNLKKNGQAATSNQCGMVG
jgi:hypothetical protein